VVLFLLIPCAAHRQKKNFTRRGRDRSGEV
jgi:hypothetical protein